MNLLSIMIYAVELIDNFNTAATVFLSGSLLFAAVLLLLRMFALEAADCEFGSTKEPTIVKMREWRTRFIWIAMISTVVLVVLPSRQTSIMIAASEVAEIVIKSDEAQTVMKDVSGLGSDAVDLLKTYIQTEQKKLIDSMKPVETKKTNDKTNT